MIFFYFTDYAKTNNSHKMDFFGEKETLEESNEPSLIKVRWQLIFYFYVVENNSLWPSM